ncbi:hypothetical protein AVEN_50373-1 [Araneus ventricosus]|uniref:Uncharacterized protein n=1 Tax=Araneus ventricosus TaxID=182803 RepID=A0A4Y2LH32_ARAVE|nr:hypothetical protein AVEN_50373-1 [Araneus ventricosus]
MAGHCLKHCRVYNPTLRGGVDLEEEQSLIPPEDAEVILDGVEGGKWDSFGILEAFFHRVSLLCRFFNWGLRREEVFRSLGADRLSASLSTLLFPGKGRSFP